MQLLEPWVLLRLLAGLVAVALLVRASVTAVKVLRHFDVVRATEGQLALERQVELAGTFVRVGAGAQIVALLLSALAADKLSRGIRGAMCAYGTFASNEWGFRALYASVLAALAAGVVAQLYAFDTRVRGMDMVRALSWATLVLAPIAIADLALQLLFFTNLDLNVIASCCSVQLDPVAAARAAYVTGPRVVATWLGPSIVLASVVVAFVAARKPRAPLVAVAGALSVLALPVAIGAVLLEVAPHAFEVPQHHCPFCLLRADVWGIGYPLFAAMFFAVTYGAGAALSALLARGPAARAAMAAFARQRLRRGAVAWLVVLAVGAFPIVRYAIVTGGASLFP